MRFSFFFFFVTWFLMGQNEYPKDYFQVPLDIPVQLSGNFGELRPNHFHAGLDFKTSGGEGLEVHAAADGYVSRIKISSFGNGKAIYINHPNGITTVYCHLQRGNGIIEEFIKKIHYKEQSFEIEMFPRANELVVKKGQVIAFSGNTGSSEGPHLHFEFRDTKSEKIINPLFFGFDKYIKDVKKPVISSVYVYPIEGSVVNKSSRPLLLNLSLQPDGTYLASKVLANGKIGFGISTFDTDNNSPNKNGAFKIQSYLNGNPSFGYQFDTYSFGEMRFVNALIDYQKYKKTYQRVQKLFMVSPYNLTLIKTDKSNGIVDVNPNLTSVYRIEVADYFGNVNKVTIPVSYDNSVPIVEKEMNASEYFLKKDRDNIFSKDDVSVFFPAGTFYEDFEMDFRVKDNILHLHDDSVPAHSYFTISMESNKYSAAQKEKVYIAEIDKNGRLLFNNTIYNDNIFSAKVRSLGNFTLAIDTVPPTITISKSIEGRWISSQKTLQFFIGDKDSGIKSYQGYLNGNWILFEYDHKTKKITHNFSDGIVAEGANDLKLIVTDNVGNSNTFESHFFRSQKL